MRLTTASLAFAALLALGCASTIPVSVDKEPGPTLARFETFAFVPDLATPMDPAFGPNAVRRVRDEVELSLRARGYLLAHENDADMLIAVGTTVAKRTGDREVHEWPAGYNVYTQRSALATPVGGVPLGSRTTVVPRGADFDSAPMIERVSRTVVMDVFDAETKDLLWRGSSALSGGTEKKADDDALISRVRAIAKRFPGA
jgi:hypothetical protein